METIRNSPISSLETNPEYNFKASPELLHLCVIDSMMPSPSRLLESNQDTLTFSIAAQFIDGDPGQKPMHITKLSSPQISATIPEALPSEVLVTSSIPQGVWASPLKVATLFPSLANSSDSSQQNLEENHFSVLSTNENWPVLSSRKQPEQSQLLPKAHSSLKLDTIDAPNSTASDIIKASKEYPWAAKMRSMCNLKRVTTPVFMEDGTPKVSIPNHVLLEGLENQKEFVVGQFYRCAAPAGGFIHAVVTRIWGRKCRIFTRKLGESSYLFHIPDEATRKWVIERGLWHVDDCLMFVSTWSPSPTISLPEISTIPVWLTLKNIPNQLYSIKGINWIASGIGEPMLTSKPWLDPTQMGEAKILVEVKLDKPFPQKVALDDKSGSITLVDVVYSWLPSKCKNCDQLGHKASHCLSTHASKSVPFAETSSIIGIGSELPLNDLATSTTITDTSPVHKSTCDDVYCDVSVDPTTTPSKTSSTPEIVAPMIVTSIDTVAPVTTTETDFVYDVSSISLQTSEVAPLALSSSPNVPLVADCANFSKNATIVTETDSAMDPSTSSLPSASNSNFFSNDQQGNFVPPPSLDLVAPLLGVTTVGMREDINSEEEEVGARTKDNRFALLEQKESFLEEASSQRSRGGRPIKPTQKIQEMQWTLVEGRSNRDRRGRGGGGGGRGQIN